MTAPAPLSGKITDGEFQCVGYPEIPIDLNDPATALLNAVTYHPGAPDVTRSVSATGP